MKKFLAPVLMISCFALAGITFFAWHDTLMASLIAAVGVLLWAAIPSGLGDVPPRGVTPDAAAVKQYRKNNPGATVADGIRATAGNQH